MPRYDDPLGCPDDPIANPVDTLRWIEYLLSPTSLGGAGRLAHVFTINGLTYPFVRHYNFAAVPDPPLSRRYDMYAGLHLARPGDLLFFFQADPQSPDAGIDSRRGIRGVYEVSGTPCRATDQVLDEEGGVGYAILHCCPECDTAHSTFSPTCPECNTVYPEVFLRCGGSEIARVLSSQISIKPLLLFERSVSDERTFGDLSTGGFVWTGRHDNAMGLGKGSSIRHLIPEEAFHLARLLLSEPGQRIGTASAHTHHLSEPLSHADGTPIEMIPTDERGVLAREDALYFILVQQTFDPDSNLRRRLRLDAPGLGWTDLEYVASNFPWGYTSGEADFVISFRCGQGRTRLLIIECKRDSAHDEAVLQVVLYADRVLQAFFTMIPEEWIPRASEVEVLPVVIARSLRRPRIEDQRLALPNPYPVERAYFGGRHVRATICTPLFYSYVPPRAEGIPSVRESARFGFAPIPEPDRLPIDWKPHLGAVGTSVEMNWILQHSWAEARQEAAHAAN